MLRPDREATRLNFAQRVALSLASAGQHLASQVLDIREHRASRRSAAETLSQLGPTAAAQVPRLVEPLQDEDRGIRMASAQAIRQLGPEAKQAARLALARQKESLYRSKEVQELEGGDPLAPMRDTVVDNLATQTVRANGKRAPIASRFPRLAAGRSSHGAAYVTGFTTGGFDDAKFRATMAFGGRTGQAFSQERGGQRRPKNQAALAKQISEYQEQLDQTQPSHVRLGALRKILTSKDLTALVDRLKGELLDCLWDVDSKVRRFALQAMGKTELNFPYAAVQSITRILEHDDEPSVRGSAAIALLRVGLQELEGKPSDSVENALLSDPDVQVRRAAAQAVASMGFQAARFSEALLRSIQEESDASVKQEVARILHKLGEASTRHLTRRLHDEDPHIRKASLDSLGTLGAGALRQRFAMGELLWDKDPEVSQAAGKALRSVLPKREGSWRTPRRPNNKSEAHAAMRGSLRRMDWLPQD